MENPKHKPERINPPETKKEDLVENLHEHEISDPYRWLEDANSPEARSWIDTQNEYTEKHLRGRFFEEFSAELVKNFKVTNFSNPAICKGKYFYQERKPDDDQASLYYSRGLDGEPVKLVDPNGMNEGNTISTDFWNPSPAGKYLAYGLSEGGDEMATLYIKDTETGEDLSERIERCRHSTTRWLPDESGFYYTRHPRPGTIPENEEHMHEKVYFHKIGDNPENDELIFGKDRPKDDMLGISLSMDGRYLAVQSSNTWTKNDIYIYDHETETTTPLIVGMDAKFLIRFLQDRAIIQTNYKADNKRVLSMPLDKLFNPIDEWDETIPESEHLLSGLAMTKSKLIAIYSVDAYSRIKIFDHDGAEKGELPLPPYSSIFGISTDRDEEEFFYGVGSFTFPKIIYRYDPDKNEYEEYRKTENPIDPEDYVIKQEWFASKDGTKVPMFIFHRKDVSGPASAILYGYGGFGNSRNPQFMRSRVPWIERGGIMAVANIRGGGEFGRKWHEEGIKDKKQNSFDDFISAAEYLIERGYTNKEQLGILGGSNGGLLVSAVEVQRPDLFKAVCSNVPLTDMVRFPQFGIASRWIHEYGDPNKKEDLEDILKWSPYHNVKKEAEYPATLFMTADKDTRVNPMHARKMTALLQAVNKKNGVFLFSEKDAGHASGRPIRKVVEDQALLLAFFAKELGLE